MPSKKKVRPAMLVIMDGWGVRKSKNKNAIAAANTPTLDLLKRSALYTELLASGEAVGLPKGIMGNSEVGHIHIGAGKIKYQDLVRVNEEIESGKFFRNNVLLAAVNHVKKHGSSLHLM